MNTDALDTVAAAREHQQLIDELWDFADPAASEARLSAAATDPANANVRLVLETQVARAVGLGGRFEEALGVLDELGARTGAESEVAVRMLLERGRVLNSSGSPADARPVFESAYELASASGFEHLAIDALHMIAIVAPADEQVALNERAFDLARGASDPRARDWRASLLNNLGWTRFEAGDLDEALALFEEQVVERVRQGKAREIGVARWSVGRALRALGRLDEALASQLDLVQWMAAAELTDSYIEEEIAECLVALGRPEDAAAHFALAAGLLEAAGPGEDPDAERLARLRGLAAQRRTTPEPEMD